MTNNAILYLIKDGAVITQRQGSYKGEQRLQTRPGCVTPGSVLRPLKRVSHLQDSHKGHDPYGETCMQKTDDGQRHRGLESQSSALSHCVRPDRLVEATARDGWACRAQPRKPQSQDPSTEKPCEQQTGKGGPPIPRGGAVLPLGLRGMGPKVPEPHPGRYSLCLLDKRKGPPSSRARSSPRPLPRCC